MSNKMLIDASHPEETRVAVVRGNRIEEYDFESQEKKQLRGNIYLAKVTRVEPSLQAAFVDYGGNRHGFLAFSEIHPDYYQIPVADRQALLEAEAEEARAARDAEDDDKSDEDAVSANSDDEEQAPAKKPKSRRGRKPKKAAEEEASTADTSEDASEVKANEEAKADTESSKEATDEGDAEETAEAKPKRRSTRRKKAPIAKKADEADNSDASEDEAKDDTNSEARAEADTKAETETEEKPKRRATRRKKAPVKKAAEEDVNETSSNDKSEDGDSDDDTPTTMAAIVETDSISEDLPEMSDADDDSQDSEQESTDTEEVSEEKPKRRSTRRKKAPVKAKKEEEASEEATESVETDETVETEQAEPTISSDEVKSEASSDTETSGDASDSDSEEEAPKKKKRAPRRSRKKKAEASPEETDDSENNDDNGDVVESVGQEDALEEVEAPRRQRRNYKIQEVIKRRQVLLVQVVKEERGNKGAALTTYLSLAGRYSVLMPNTARGGGISRKITNAADRKRLKAIANGLDVPNGMGVILRTAGASRTNAEIERDFDYLMRLWEQVRNLTLSSSAPCLVYEEGSLIKRSIRDLFEKDTNEVLVSGEEGFNEAKDFMSMLMPSAAKKVKLHKDKQALFTKFGVETQLDKMVTPQVTLKSGGYLIIDQTEALVSVDVNSGRSTREHSIENTALQTNLEAAEEVARQLRLRDLAGLVVIDFIDMEEKRNNRAVEKKLKECLKNDRARIQVGRISHFGLLEMSRQRMRASVLESTMDVCSHCGGTGHVRSDSAIALHVFRAIEEHVSRHNRYDAVIKTTPSIALHILNHKRAALLELENRYCLAIIIEGTRDIKGQDFEILKGELASGEVKSNAVGYQNSALDEDETSPDEKASKRGRNNLKKKDDASEIDDENQEDTQTSEQDEDDDKPRKKRRRGKRGGRRRNNSADNADTQENDAEATNDDASKTDGEASQAELVKAETVSEDSSEPKAASDPETNLEAASEAEASEEKPKRRSTTRRKAPVSKTAEPAAATEASEADATKPAEASEEPPRPKRRTTRRKKDEEAPEAQSDDSALEATSAEASAETSNEDGAESPEKSSSIDEDDGSGQDGKKKKSWWNRGGSFF